MKLLAPALITTLSVLVSSTEVQAEELRTNRIPAGTRWLAHIDIESALSSGLFSTFMEQAKAHGADLNLGEFEQEVGLNPLEDFKSITVFSAGETPEPGVAMLVTSSKLDHALELIREKVDFNTVEVDGITLQQWSQSGESIYSYIMRVKGKDKRVVVASERKNELVEAVKVLRRQAPSLADNQNPAIKGSPADGAFFFVAASEIPGWEGNEAASKVAQLARRLVFQGGERNGNTFLNVNIETREGKDARKVMQIVQGAIALGSLVASQTDGELDQLMPFLQGLTCQADGSSVRIGFEAPTAELLKHLQESGR